MRQSNFHIVTASVFVLTSYVVNADAADAADSRRDPFVIVGTAQPENALASATTQARVAGTAAPSTAVAAAPTEAPTGFDNLTNGYLDQGPAFEDLDEDNVVALRSFNDNRFIFEEVEAIGDGLGPTYNAQSCRECHQNVVTGGASQIAEHRTGRLNGGQFFESLGGSLIHSRATYPEIVEHVAFQDDVRTFRMSTNTLGDGFVEAIANSTLLAIRDGQPFFVRGSAIEVPVMEAGGNARIGRLGWKSQHASLQSFSADAYLNEMGITSPMMPDENTSSGEDVSYGTRYDPVPEPEDEGDDVLSFTKQEAIRRHLGQATGVTKRYNALSDTQKRQVLTFLDSL